MTATTKRIDDKDRLASMLEENSEKLLTCVHCGLCLPSCPTYRELGNENDSPRGRVYLMRGLVEGKLQMGDAFISHIDLCLGCRACETVCPSGVPYGHLLEAARVEVARAKRERPSIKERATERAASFILNRIFTSPRLLGALMSLARSVRDTGFARLAFDNNLVSGRLRLALALLLASRSPFGNRQASEQRIVESEAAAEGTRVALLRGCVMEGLFREVNRATERVLSRQGCELVEAGGQMCCGALHAHAGQIETARELARNNIRAFAESGCEFVIVNSAGCGAAMKEYDALLADDPEYAGQAKEFVSKVKDVSEFLINRGLAAPQHGIKRRITYDAPCHLIHAQRIAEAPVDVLEAIPGLSIIALKGAENCCGGAGIYNLQHTELSAKILSDKIGNIRASGAQTVATANPGCIMQIGAGALLAGLDVEVVHPIELLDAAYGESKEGQELSKS